MGGVTSVNFSNNRLYRLNHGKISAQILFATSTILLVIIALQFRAEA